MVAARRAAAGALTALLLASSSGSPLAAEVLPASIHGVLLGPDGKPATDHAMVLIDDRGATAGRATTRPDGRYELRGIAPGSFHLGVVLPNGQVAPVRAPALLLEPGAQARRDVRLVRTAQVEQTAPASGGGGFWSGATGVGKTWIVAGGVTALIILAAAIDDDEVPASPF